MTSLKMMKVSLAPGSTLEDREWKYSSGCWTYRKKQWESLPHCSTHH